MMYRSPHVDFIYQEGATDYLVVTFNPINIRANGRHFWGDQFFKDQNISALGIVSTKRNWFPWEGMEALLEAARPILNRYTHVCAYGSSMGAYGAIKYSRLLGAQTVVAFSPQHSINPKHEKYPSQFASYYDEKIHQDVAIQEKDLGGNIFLFYDPHHRVDGYAAHSIAELSPQVNRIPVPYIGHTTIMPFAKAKKGVDILRLAMAAETGTLRRMSHEVRRKSRLRPRYLSCALVPNHLPWALEIIEKYPEALEEQSLDNFCKALMQARKTEEAIVWLRQFVIKHPDDARACRNLASFLHRELQRPDQGPALTRFWRKRQRERIYREAVEVMQRAIQLDPANQRQFLLLGWIFASCGKSEEALRVVTQAVEMSAGNASSYKYQVSLLKGAGLMDQAVEALRVGAEKFPDDPFFRHLDAKEKTDGDFDEDPNAAEEITVPSAPLPRKKKKKKSAWKKLKSLGRRIFQGVVGPKDTPVGK